MTDRTRAITRALSRLFDELPLIILGAIALDLIHNASNANLAGLVHDGVLAIITGILGYMKGRSDGQRAALTRSAAPTTTPVAASPEAPKDGG